MDSSKNYKSYKEYLKENVEPIIKPLKIELLRKKPTDNLLLFIKEYLQGLKESSFEIKPSTTPHTNSFTSDEEEVYDLAQIKEEKKKFIGKKKTSISAEVFGDHNKLTDFKPPVIPKTEEQSNNIKKVLLKSFYFSALNKEDQDKIINAMSIVEYKPNDYVIKQGDDGNLLYLVAEGELSCYKKFTKEGEDVFLKKYGPGDSFGELSLLYNTPRAASIIADTNSTLYALDSRTFNIIVKMSAIKKRDDYISFLRNVELLSSLNDKEIDKLIDCILVKHYSKGDYIIKEGDDGNSFFILVKGSLTARKVINGEEKIVFEYKEKDYFGELSLLRKMKRAANIISETDNCEVLEIDRFAFDNLLGPLEEILKRNTEMYEKFIPKTVDK